MITPPEVDARRGGDFAEWLARSPLAGRPLAFVDQQHGARVVDASQTSPAAVAAADGMVAAGDEVLAIFCADCAPVWLADAKGAAFALLHAGWRGVAAGIVESGVSAMTAAGVAPDDMTAYVGPHLRSCCFEVGPEVAERFAAVPGAVLPASALRAPRARADSVALDLLAVIKSRLTAAGVHGAGVSAAAECTRCSAAGLHSYRRNGPGGPLMAAIGARA